MLLPSTAKMTCIMTASPRIHRILLCLIIVFLSVSCQRERDVRLSGERSNSISAGIIEVFYNGSWSLLCDSQLRTEEGSVICRQLGFDGVEELHHGLPVLTLFGSPNIFDMLQQQVVCGGSEASLVDCTFGEPMVNACIVTQMSGVTCQPPLEVQLVGSTEPEIGIVEIQQNGRRLMLCDEDWSRFDASVVCRSLGYNYASSVPSVDMFNRSSESGEVSVSIECTGSEDGLSNCVSTSSSEITTGTCSTASRTVATANCTSQPKQRIGDEIRLVDGEFPGEGRVQVSFLGEWFRLSCNVYQTRETAGVVCRQLGFPYLVMRDYRRKYSPGQLPFYYEVSCRGNETSIADCPSEKQEGTCYYDYIISIVCSSEEPPVPGSIVRLVQGTTEYEGRVEVRVGNRWGTVCSDSTWDINAANVVCRQLGYEPPIAAPKRAYFGVSPLTSYLGVVVCNGTESNLSQCQFRGPESVNCNRQETAGVICGNNRTIPQDYELRLVGGTEPHEGRVEIGYQGQWGSICAESFLSSEGGVICRMLGYPTGVFYHSAYGNSEGPVVLSGLSCNGFESHILDCPHDGPPGSCPSGDSAGVYCGGTRQEYQDFDIRFGEENLFDEGRAEVYYNGSWGYMCYSSLNEDSLAVLCNQLGYADKNFNLSSGGKDTHLLPSPLVPQCTQNEAKLAECRLTFDQTLTQTGCGVGGIAYINCDQFIPPVPPKRDNKSIIIKAVSLSILVLLALISFGAFIVRKCCLSSSDEGAIEASPVTTATGTYTPVAQNDQMDGKAMEAGSTTTKI